MAEEIVKNEEQVNDEEQVEAPEAEETKDEEKKYTDKDVDEIINKKFAKWQKDQEAKIQEEKRLSKLSAEERAKEEARRKDDEIAKLRAEIDRNNLEKDTIERLNDEKLPLTFKPFLMGNDAETTNDNIKAFKEVYAQAIQEEVEKRFKGKTPKGATGTEKVGVWDTLRKKYE